MVYNKSELLAPSYTLTPPNDTREAMHQGFEIAETERRRLGLGVGRIADMAELLTEQGIWATGAKLPNSVSGFCIKHSKVGICIVVNYSHPKGRKRFSYAHEYGHAIMDRGDKVNVTNQDNAAELIETRANCFAAAFLAPELGIRDALADIQKGQPSREMFSVFSEAAGFSTEAEIRRPAWAQVITYQDVARLAHHFLISYQSSCYRLRSIGVINAKKLSELLDQEDTGNDYLELIGINTVNEYNDPDDRELVASIIYHASNAYRNKIISRNRFQQILFETGLDLQRCRKILDLTAALQEFD
jgi:Zn-dependent peptidase ImmA (M78 family)